MPRGDKRKYSVHQRHKAEKIEESYETRGVPKKEAEARAWATVNKQDGGGTRAGSGRNKPAAVKRAARRDSASRGVATKHGHSPNRGAALKRKSAKKSGRGSKAA